MIVLLRSVHTDCGNDNGNGNRRMGSQCERAFKPLKFIHTDRFCHRHRNKYYIDEKNGYAIHSACDSDPSKRLKLSTINAMMRVMEPFSVNRPLLS